MTTRDKIRHLHRRFAYGITTEEAQKRVRGGVAAAFDEIFDLPDAEKDVVISPWRFASTTARFDLGPNPVAAWWISQMVLSKNPAREKLSLFWHDHFAVGADKVYNGPLMFTYLQTVRRLSLGSFTDLLFAVSKDPAMILYLDSHRNVKGRPNENFGREVMELFTMGVDNGYTEDDIQEAAKAFTGWSFKDKSAGLTGDEHIKKIKSLLLFEGSRYEFFDRPNYHEVGEKTVLGEKVDTGDDVLNVLAVRPETAKYICTKLWEYYAYPDPEPQVIERLAKVFLDNRTQIRAVLKEMSEMDEFFSDRAEWSRIKCPADFVIGFLRPLQAASYYEEALVSNDDPFVPLPGPTRSFGFAQYYQMNRMGMQLLFPPDVEGWHWGESWITTDTVLQRNMLAKRVLRKNKYTEEMAGRTAARLMVKPGRGDTALMMTKLFDTFDISFASKQRTNLIAKADSLGGNKALADSKTARTFLSDLLGYVMAMPESHIC
jgi:uncharacterized protein (DUF1800 family)